MALMNDHETQYDLLRSSCGVLADPHAGLIELTGEDRKGWLQGQVTNDLRNLQIGGSASFCVIEPTGQMIGVCQVWSLPDRLLISTDADCKGGLLRRVEQMVILEDVQAKDLSDEYRLISVQGPDASSRLAEVCPLPSLDAGLFRMDSAGRAGNMTTGYCLRSDRTGSGGWDLWLIGDEKLPFEKIGGETLDMARVEAGIPKWGRDIGPRTLPNEMGRAFVGRHVSFTKGCYTGQEVVMRIHSRGHTNRTWVGLSADSPLRIGDAISHRSRRDAGIVTSAVISPRFGPIGAAMLRNETLEGPVTVHGESGETLAEVVELPFIRYE